MAGEDIVGGSGVKTDGDELKENENDRKDTPPDVTDDFALDLLNDHIINRFEEKLDGFPELRDYIYKLHSCIRKQHGRIEKLLAEIREQTHETIRQCLDAAVQTDFEIETLEELDRAWQADKEAEKSDKVWEKTEDDKPVAELVKEAAESALQQTGFVFEETSGMYYDYNTGYYYNAELGLYYDGNSGTYYYYDENNTFQYHSRVEQTEVTEVPVEESKTRRKEKKKPNEERRKRKAADSLEEGECSDTSEECDSSSNPDTSCDELETEQTAGWPPCMRIIIKETNVPSLKVGSLFIVPYTGGTVGREGDHAFCLRDINVSKVHLRLEFDEPEGKFFVVDLGSRNGTILNGQKVEEGAENRHEVVHGSTLELGGTKLLCHIHTGRDSTCGHCEPGLIQQTKSEPPKVSECPSGESKGSKYRKEMKRLRRKFGLESSEPNMSALSVPGYEDRAQTRRVTVGSQNPHEKTQMASIDEPIPAQNKGFQLLERMGWSQGQSLGKDGEGCTEPVTVTATQGTAGLGSNPAPGGGPATVAAAIAGTAAGTASGDGKTGRWLRAQQRYNELTKRGKVEEKADSE